MEGLKQRASIVRAAFDPTYRAEHLIAEGDKVAVMWSARCEQVGEWFGFSPCGKIVTFRGVNILLLREGRQAEHWDVVDSSEFLVAVGAMPASAGTIAAELSASSTSSTTLGA